MTSFFKAQAPKIAKQIIALRDKTTKADIGDEELAAVEAILAGVDFAGWAVLVGDVQPILEDVVQDGMAEGLIQIGIGTEARKEILNIVNPKALEYSEARSAEMVGMRIAKDGELIPNPNAKWRIDESTRDYLREYVRGAMQEGWSNDKLADELKDAYAFSDDRAMMIARTETAKASSTGALEGYKASGVVEGKRWLTAEDDKVSEECEANGKSGPNGDGILADLDGMFPSGDAAPPVHPNCRCALLPVVTFASEKDSNED